MIKQGARIISSGAEILEELGMKGDRREKRDKGDRKVKGDSEEEQLILDLLHDEKVHVDVLVRQTGIAASRLGGILSNASMRNFSLDCLIFPLIFIINLFGPQNNLCNSF